jgi:hypothetical protein
VHGRWRSSFWRSQGQEQFCSPEPFGVDPIYGNFTPTSWSEGSFNWVNNPMGAQFLGVWANTDFDMWFVGYTGLRLPVLPIPAHFDGSSLQTFQLPGTGAMNAVWGSDSNDVWAVGERGLIQHWDGAQWLIIPSGTTTTHDPLCGDGHACERRLGCRQSSDARLGRHCMDGFPGIRPRRRSIRKHGPGGDLPDRCTRGNP